MKEKNLPDDNISQSLEELTKEANEMIANLEKEKDLHNSIDNYQNLIKLNNIIEKKFQNRFRKINQITKEKIDRIVNKKNEKKT
jgi:exonuclease VII small subunit